MSRLSSIFLIGQFLIYASPASADDQEGETPSYSLDHVLGRLMHDPALSRTDFGVQVVNVHTGRKSSRERAVIRTGERHEGPHCGSRPA